MLLTLPLLLLCKLVAFRIAKLFSGWWQHVSIHDVLDIVRGNVLASVLFLIALVYMRGLHSYPRSVVLIDLLICTAAMGGVRVAIRVWRERGDDPGTRHIESVALIVGAGSAGIRLLDEIESRPHLRTAVAGFVDDDVAKVGLRVSGSPVLGRVDHIPELVRVHDINEVLVAIPSASGALLRRIVRLCEEARVRHRVLPSLGELVGGRVMFAQMREVKVDDLLAREPVRLDLVRVRAFIAGRTVLVTGAAGSIGSELCRQVAAQKPERVVLYDRHENGMFALEKELQARLPEVRSSRCWATSCSRTSSKRVFAAFRPELVFHAAAYKHVSHGGAEPARSGAQQHPRNAQRRARRRSPTARRSSCWSRPTRPCGRRASWASPSASPRWWCRASRTAAAVSSPCASATCSARTAAWCRSSATRSRAAAR